MNLYLDDDSAKASLVALLRRLGHQVTTPTDAGIAAVSDPRHLRYTVENARVLLTKLSMTATLASFLPVAQRL